MTRSLLPARSVRGSWAMSSGGRSYSKSEVRSGSGVKDGCLSCRRLEPEATIGQGRGAAAALGAFQEPLLDEIGLIDVLQGSGILTHGHRYRAEPDRAAAELLDNDRKDPGIHVIQPELVHVEPAE